MDMVRLSPEEVEHEGRRVEGTGRGVGGRGGRSADRERDRRRCAHQHGRDLRKRPARVRGPHGRRAGPRDGPREPGRRRGGGQRGPSAPEGRSGRAVLQHRVRHLLRLLARLHERVPRRERRGGRRGVRVRVDGAPRGRPGGVPARPVGRGELHQAARLARRRAGGRLPPALRHLPDRLPRRGDGGRAARLDRGDLRRGPGPGCSPRTARCCAAPCAVARRRWPA